MSLLWLINIMTATEITHVFNLRNSSMLTVKVNEGLVNQHILTNGACGIIYCKHGSFCELIVIYILIWLNFQICLESFSFWLFLFQFDTQNASERTCPSCQTWGYSEPQVVVYGWLHSPFSAPHLKGTPLRWRP